MHRGSTGAGAGAGGDVVGGGAIHLRAQLVSGVGRLSSKRPSYASLWADIKQYPVSILK